MDQLYAFESWHNGNQIQLSPLYENVNASEFISNHYRSNSFATLHVFRDKLAAEKVYVALQEQPDDEVINYQDNYEDEREYDEDMNNIGNPLI